jgi:amidohydrolase
MRKKKFILKEIIPLRKELHQHPEVSGDESKTAQRILYFLSNYQPNEIITNLGGHGILAIYKGKKEGKSILFRCELDALPIQETNSFDHKSIYNGVSHKCGHDGHMAILCGLAKRITENPLQQGTVMLLFQPAEENGTGAKSVVTDSKFKKINIDYAFALHNLPGFPLHQIVVKEHAFTCAVNSMVIELHGKTSHAGEPENGINPALAISEIIVAFDKKNQTDISKDDYCLITPIYIMMGEKAYGVSAGYGEVHFTIRSDSNAWMQKTERALETMVLDIALKHHLKSKIRWTDSFQANENDVDAVHYVKKSAIKLDLNIQENKTPFTFGEDFGFITQKFKGTMFGLGAGENLPSLHNPDYDFPDEIIETGIALFDHITKEILHA